ncbi:hypothetical protein LZD49_34005 [Dyadobacter sp. CY261]|uniref:hypothetical protein n=1 Tax=Dyadobacter sp. CY261 TaxID=2907203 RepID=UPI001F3284A3|nr:hypothetical protein [Dyadobacter sp. CY261]MCF0075539.1 hypothetical protein [Dyadobacter sp. CY261]
MEYLGINVNRILLMLGLFAGIPTCHAQHWEQTKPLRYIWDVDKRTGEKRDLYTYLMRDVRTENNCSATWGIFYFRVTERGMVDSVYHQGTLRDIVVKQIVSNIYATQGHWKSQAGKPIPKRYWFIYPYYDFGPYSFESTKCNDSEKVLQKNLVKVSESMLTIRQHFRSEGYYMLNPTIISSENPRD